MKLLPSGVGAEPKKLAILGAILVAGAAVYWFQYRSDAPVAGFTASPVTPSQQTASGGQAPAPGAGSARTADPAIADAAAAGSGGPADRWARIRTRWRIFTHR